MGFFDKLFGKSDDHGSPIICPRCMGKGHVDMADIKRMGKELYWLPGPCAYCKGETTVNASQTSVVAIDEVYLSTGLSDEERDRIVNGDMMARHRASDYKKNADRFIEDVFMLYIRDHLTAEQIADIIIKNNPEIDTTDEKGIKEKEELISYIKKVIEKKIS